MATTTTNRLQHLRWINDIKYEHLIAGVSGGMTATLILHPLDLLKIRFAVNDGSMVSAPKYQGIANAFQTIVRQEGFLGLYRGVIPNLWGAGSAWGLYFLFYNSIKTSLQGGDHSKALNAGTHLLAASEAGLITLFITNPIWVVKTRMCLQYSDTTQLKTSNIVKYTGMVDALVKIYKAEGFTGYYKGILPGIFGVSHGAVQFMTYEELKNRYNQYKKVPITTKLSTAEYLTFAAISKLVAVSLTYPYQVVRARLQNQHYAYSGSWDCIKRTWTHESWRGFYKGLGTNLIRVTPATMITFLTYENVSHFLVHRQLAQQ